MKIKNGYKSKPLSFYRQAVIASASVTAVGMFSEEAVWFIPHGTATVLITVGSISKKVIETDGHFVSREHLCLTASFDHNIVDGAPASRFMNQLVETIKSENLLQMDIDTKLQENK